MIRTIVRRSGFRVAQQVVLNVLGGSLVHTKEQTLGDVEGWVQDNREGDRDVQLHEHVRQHNGTPVRRKAERRQASVRLGVDRPQQIT
ncbi:hypothetical protein ON010_g16777 [Phytophthora cinnamomi]|nr:hypothetical protein ON010_g16777 [Phytophthora cinnamomi]